MGMVEVLQALFVVRVVSGDEFSKKCVSVHGSWCIKVEVIMNGYRDQDMHLFATKVACASCGGMLKVCSMFVQILGEGVGWGTTAKKSHDTDGSISWRGERWGFIGSGWLPSLLLNVRMSAD